MNSSKGHLSKKDVRFRTEVFVLVVKVNCMREGKLKSRRSVKRKRNVRLVSFGSRPPKTAPWNSMSLSVILGSLAISRCSSIGADLEKQFNKCSR